MTSQRTVPRIGRVLDAVGALFFLAGAVVYARSWFGLRDMDSFERHAGAPAYAAVERADALSRLGAIGFGLMATGVLIGIAAAVVARRRSRSA